LWSPFERRRKMINPVETRYKGYRFRSRTEARWAVYFDALWIAWEYEKEGYDLSEHGYGWYLPDFWLPQVHMWAEVKPGEFSEEEKTKCILLASLTDHECLLLTGTPAVQSYWAVTGKDKEGDDDYWTRSKNEYALTNLYVTIRPERRFYCDPEFIDGFDDIREAVEAARAARFESPTTKPDRRKMPCRYDWVAGYEGKRVGCVIHEHGGYGKVFMAREGRLAEMLWRGELTGKALADVTARIRP
jgi:hypothetical protein